MRGAVSLTVNVSRSDRFALSPAMRFIPQHLVRPDPPVKLLYNMTTEGELTLYWTDSQPGAGLLTCDVRYSSNSSLNSWVHVDNVRTQPVSLKGMVSGVTYTVQVRCKKLGESAVWSGWSQDLSIYLPEVMYLPETVFSDSGANVTVYCILNNRSLNARNVVWWLNGNEEVPESLYTVVNDRVSSVTLPNARPQMNLPFSFLQCCQRSGASFLCSYRYASLYTEDVSVPITCETNGDLSAMTCRWNISEAVKFYFRSRDLPCYMTESEEDVSPAEECPIERRGLKSCTFKPLLSWSCYMMWLEFGNEERTVKSRPVYVTPVDLVKPYPPSKLEAATLPEGYLSARWERPDLPPYELQYEVRYAVDESDAQWRVFKAVNQSAVLPVLEPCMVHAVSVRCKRLYGPGSWSDWSDPYYTAVHVSKAPERGPDFWRVLKEDHERNQTNVTLLFAPLTREEALYCVEGFVVRHQTTRGTVWRERLGLVSAYTFPWTEEAHTVSVLAINFLGSSTKNTNVTLTRRANKPRSISSFSSVIINGSCAALAWSLLPNSSAPASFVVEWGIRSREGGQGDPVAGVKWERVPATSRSFYLHDKFYATEEYQFILHPIFPNGEGEPVYNKEERGSPSAKHAAYALLMIIAFLSVVLFLTLAVSQRRMMKLVWKDVPNPNNCSWAQGVDFRKAETIENLFRHPEQITSCPLLLEIETISEAVIVEKVLPAMPLEKQQAGWADKALQTSGTSSSASMGGSGQSSVTYATVLPPRERGRAWRRPPESLSSCSDEGNFSANASDLSGSYPGTPWEPEGMQSNSRRPCHSYNSTEEYSENSDQEDQSLDGTGSRRDLFYLGMTSRNEEEEEDLEEEEEEVKGRRFQTGATLDHSLESSPLLSQLQPHSHRRESSGSGKGIPLYMPQFQTANNISETQSTRGQ
ncbi:hypothetical protein AGOR_G00238900 [Albula goreensis]|uniref:Leptin receptor n=1 Tax=Albula goreensis TaxID=1534307 RepID=A0A8T3CJC9_9TELE|nr:hypothetical protein AGOR_G00238900 [Albula goreensis]